MEGFMDRRIEEGDREGGREEEQRWRNRGTER